VSFFRKNTRFFNYFSASLKAVSAKKSGRPVAGAARRFHNNRPPYAE
jgi:hypothetical protein